MYLIKQDEVAKFVAKKLGIPEELIRSSEEMQQAAQQMQQMMGQQQGNGARTIRGFNNEYV